MNETRTALARLFINLAIVTIPAGMMHRYSELFCVVDKLRADRARQKKKRRSSHDGAGHR